MDQNLRPVTQFCCGCSLSFGAWCIIALNLAQNLFYIITATSNVILRIPTFGSHLELTTQTLNAALCMIGLPFILAAAWGVFCRLEAPVRLYLYYMIASFGLDLAFMGAEFIAQDVCQTMPAILKKHGMAFACGVARLAAFAYVTQVIVIQLYFIFTIWSLCEEFQAGGAGQGFPQLLRGPAGPPAPAKRYLAPRVDAYSYLLGPATDGYRGYGFGVSGGASLGGQSRIFGGERHDMAAPSFARLA